MDVEEAEFKRIMWFVEEWWICMARQSKRRKLCERKIQEAVEDWEKRSEENLICWHEI